jgi:hypothetical protein
MRHRLALGLAGLILIVLSGTALAAEVTDADDIYVLPKGEVVQDDLYVAAREVLIQGTVDGDLVAAGSYVEVSGVVMGDVIAAGGGVVVSGAVEDDARLAGGGVVVTGSIGDDLFGAGGGGWQPMAMIPLDSTGRNVPQGIQLDAGATVGGDMVVVGGRGALAGTVGGKLAAAMGTLALAGQVTGDAELRAETLTIAETARVDGTLRYAAGRPVEVPSDTAATVEGLPQATVADDRPENPFVTFFWWVLRTALILLGLAALAWLVWSFAPQQVRRPVQALEHEPVEAGIYGILVAVAVVPVSAALVFLAVVIWGWFPGGVVMFTLLFGLFGLIWLVSPLVTGLWVGRKLAGATGAVRGELAALLLGVVVIVLVARLLALVPCVGGLAAWAIYLLSFALAVGGWLGARRRRDRVVVQPA